MTHSRSRMAYVRVTRSFGEVVGPAAAGAGGAVARSSAVTIPRASQRCFMTRNAIAVARAAKAKSAVGRYDRSPGAESKMTYRVIIRIMLAATVGVVASAVAQSSQPGAITATHGVYPNLVGNTDRPLRYRPDGADFVIENGQ